MKNPDGGITIDTQTGVEHGKPGEYAVSLEGPQVVLDAGTLSPNDLAKFIATNSALLSSGHGDYFGAWHDPVDHKVYLDVSHIETSREAAAAIARANHQIAYFDFAAMHSVDVEARKARKRPAYESTSQ